MRTVVLVPYRSDGGRRDLMWRYLQHTYWKPIGLQVFEGEHRNGKFNRSLAVNRAAVSASQWDVAVIADADTWVPPDQLATALEIAAETGKLTAAFTSVCELTHEATDCILSGESSPITSAHIETTRTDDLATQSSMLVVTRQLWDATGGLDERFVGWSAEDNAWWKACEILGGQPLRIPGCAFHLWHHSARPDRRDPDYLANQQLWKRYSRCRTEQQLRDL